MELRPTEVVLFGNPRGGTPLMQAVQTMGIDLPLKALVWQDAAGKTWLGYNDPSWLARRHGALVGTERRAGCHDRSAGRCCKGSDGRPERMRMNILVTGSSGWLGQTLVPRLARDGHKVVGLDPDPGATTDGRGLGGRSRAGASHHPRARASRPSSTPRRAHKPHIETHDNSEFVAVNVQGTLNLLEEAVAPGSTVDRFVFTSTTSLMISQKIRDGRAGGANEAIWIDETMTPLEPRNIYGVTKRAAEELCRLFNHLHRLPILILRTSRFFPEEDDMAHAIVQSGENTKANEFLFRRLPSTMPPRPMSWRWPRPRRSASTPSSSRR